MTRYFRRVIRITALDSPNVRLAFLQKQQGRQPTNEILVPGVLPYADYVKRLATWDEIRQCIGLHAQFYEGSTVLLFPPLWLDRAARIHQQVRNLHRQALAIGVDTGEGRANTSLCAVDDMGIVDLQSQKTPDTSVICGLVLAFMRKHNVAPEKVLFDRGGGGKQRADDLRAMGFQVKTLGFGEAPSMELKRGLHMLKERKEVQEDRIVYKNMRAQMYGEARLLLDESLNPDGFGIPGENCGAVYAELRRQLSPLPLWYDKEGQLYLPPKQSRPDRLTKTQEITMQTLIGCSPDEADALVLALHAMLHVPKPMKAGALR